MELTTVLVTHLHPFSNNISLDTNALDDALDASLIAFTTDIEAAVPSSRSTADNSLERTPGHPDPARTPSDGNDRIADTAHGPRAQIRP